ncbi:MAG: PorP/SprF family type IX secretion system membrane protein [Bacteroidota bacterium]|nr:MAG: PorP/SprF family type IX secretion system membrane protein [Bacteroidota bacterium]
MKKLVFLLIAISTVGYTLAQQLPNVSYFMYDHARTNPGSLGSKDMICASLILKRSYIDFGEGAPSNEFLNAEVPFKLFGAKHGVGISAFTDKIGFYNDVDVKLGYAFRFNVAEGTLGIGISGGVRQKTLDASKWQYGANGDELDPNIPQGTQENIFGFGFGAGLFYRSEDIYLGASVSNIYPSDIEYDESTAIEDMQPHYYITAGYTFQLANPAFEVEPAVLIFSDNLISTTFDLNATLTYNKKIWGGVSYRAGSAVAAMAGLMILDGLKVGLAYDYPTSALSNGSFEVLLNYCFSVGGEKSPQRYRSIRYL